MPVSISVTVSQRDIARIEKRLAKWQGASLAKRMDKALAQGAQLFKKAIQLNAPSRAGGLRSSTKVSRLRIRGDEVAAYRIAPTKRVPDKGRTDLLSAILVHGTKRGVEANPFVDRAYDASKELVNNFVAFEVKRLA